MLLLEENLVFCIYFVYIAIFAENLYTLSNLSAKGIEQLTYLLGTIKCIGLQRFALADCVLFYSLSLVHS